MRKIIISMIMTLVVLASVVATPATTVYACENSNCTCTCSCCKDKDKGKIVVDAPKKTNPFKKPTNDLLKPAKSYAKKYSWTVETKVTKKTSKKQYTSVHFYCAKTHIYMDVVIRATKGKDGKVTAEWWFKSTKGDGAWKKTSLDSIKAVLKRSGKKA